MPKCDEDANQRAMDIRGEEGNKGRGCMVAKGGIARDHWRVKPLKAATPAPSAKLLLSSSPLVIIRFGLVRRP